MGLGSIVATAWCSTVKGPSVQPMPSLPLTQVAGYKLGNRRLDMEEEIEKKQWCRRCHGDVLHPTLDPNEMRCNYCGWSKFVVDLKDYCASKGYVGPPPSSRYD